MKYLFLFFFVIPVALLAQEKRSKMQWRSIASAGLIAGRTGNEPMFQLSGGLKFHKFYTGIGTGYDGYKFKSFPIFIDLRCSPGKNQQLFFYGLGGYHFTEKNVDKEEWLKVSDRLKGGFYADAGLGYFVAAGKRSRFAMSAGLTYKNLSRVKLFAPVTCITGDCENDVFKLRHKLGRLTAKLSWEFGY